MRHALAAFSLAIACLAIICLLSGGAVHAAEPSSAPTAEQVLKATGVRGGLVVHMPCGDGKLTTALRANASYMVQGLDRDAAKVAVARKHARQAKLYGQVSFDRINSNRLPYADNLVNLFVSESLGDMPMSEVLRALAPNGVAYIKSDGVWKKTVKPVPGNIDEWSHYLHDASGNAVAQDDVVGPPRHLQWIAGPRWSRHHDRMASMSALVSAGGRMFYIMDEGSRVSIQLPPKWMLVARDAFNGTILWKKPIPDWQNHLWPLKSGPTSLARRLVATRDRVFVTLGYKAPITALDAATGEHVTTYKNSDGAEELIVTNGAVFALVNKQAGELDNFSPKFNTGDQARVRTAFKWNEKPRMLMGFSIGSGQASERTSQPARWSLETKIAPLSLAADGERVFFHDGEKVVCLDQQSGKEVWHSKADRKAAMTFNFGPKMVVYKHLVLFAGGNRKMKAMEAATGKVVWESAHERGGYQSPEDLLVAGGLVWSAPLTSGRDSGVFTGRDPLTGETRKSFPPDVKTYWFHHRCYIAKATNKYLMPSRTGIEFVDPNTESWDIHHWVRGGCLYGVMPCNGLVYAPPHNCACYPEAKLYGFNALAPSAPTRKVPRDIPDADRIEQGPAFQNQPATPRGQTPPLDDWPTYRQNARRNGHIPTEIPTALNRSWSSNLGGTLSTVTIADGRLFVAQPDKHLVHALDAGTGDKLWQFSAGGRVDSPPTIHKGRVLFGSADGYVYCVGAEDGQLIWRFRAAPEDVRLTSFEQIESVWPVHGSVLVKGREVYCVAGRSMFLDGGLRFLKLDLYTGRKIAEKILDHIDPSTGKSLQDRIAILQMPVGLPDVLSSDGANIYMRSQVFDLDGNRTEIGPHSSDPAKHTSVQRGDTAHVFSPTGFLDGSYFHRSYWVYGRSFAGGHNGYYQAGKRAPAGRILVHNQDTVFGFGRKPQYLKWTTTLEHHLFATDKQPPVLPGNQSVAKPKGKKGKPATTAALIRVGKPKTLDPTGKAIAVEAWIKPGKADGVILAHGGPAQGYALVLRAGRPAFHNRAKDELATVRAAKKIGAGWTHLVGQLTADKKLKLYVNGKLVATAAAVGLLTEQPLQGLEIGADEMSAVGAYKSPFAYTGLMDEVRLYHGTLTDAEVAARFKDHASTPKAKIVLNAGFDRGTATDNSGMKHHGALVGATPTDKGHHRRAMVFTGPRAGGKRGNAHYVQYKWNNDIPVMATAMVLSKNALFVAGPPDIMDEEKTFKQIIDRDKKVHALLARQDEALSGKHGGILRIVSPLDGKKIADHKLDFIPVWDGMAAANGRLYLATKDGRIVCFQAK